MNLKILIVTKQINSYSFNKLRVKFFLKQIKFIKIQNFLVIFTMSNLGNTCPFCLKPLDEADCAKLYPKGCNTINKLIRQSPLEKKFKRFELFNVSMILLYAHSHEFLNT